MFNLRKQLAPRHTVALKFIGHDHAWHVIKAIQQPSEKPFGRLTIPPWLNEDVEHDAVLIRGAPNLVLHSLDPDEYFVELPFLFWSGPAVA